MTNNHSTDKLIDGIGDVVNPVEERDRRIEMVAKKLANLIIPIQTAIIDKRHNCRCCEYSETTNLPT